MNTPPPRSGVLAGGNWIVDHVKTIDGWPPQDALANILAESWGNGGSPYNILKGLAKLGAGFPLAGIGLVGRDSDGERILADCRAHRIDTAQLRQTPHSPTSYSDVMTDGATGRRTFFHQRGANALLSPSDCDFTTTRAKIFHLGYVLLLDGLDTLENDEPRTCQVLRSARAAGLLTAIDCVSENSDRFHAVVKPVLSETDVLFVNDFEAEKLTGVSLRALSGAPVQRAAVEMAARKLIDLGVRRWVVIHFPEAVHALGADGTTHWQPSLDAPASFIKGAAGAGDAFASGVLLGIHDDWNISESLRLGVCVAACSLADSTCSDGILTADQCLQLAERFAWRALPE